MKTVWLSVLLFTSSCIQLFAQQADAHGAIVRGDSTKKEVALVFTADEFGEGGEIILKALRKHQVKASFFLTGNFYKNPTFTRWIKAARKAGHYLGPHSDKHLLYADWKNRDSLLVSKQEFTDDLLENLKRMKTFGIDLKSSPYFLPPYEWYNNKIAAWTRELQMTLINFTPGTRTPADYTYPEMGTSYRSSESIYQSVWDQEKKLKSGLNGFILLIHLGTDPRRKDKFYNKLDSLVTDLKSRGYRPVRINELLDNK